MLNKLDVDYCAREITTTKSIIDHVSSNFKESDYRFAIIYSSMLDHNQTYLEIKQHKPQLLTGESYDALDYIKYIKLLKKT